MQLPPNEEKEMDAGDSLASTPKLLGVLAFIVLFAASAGFTTQYLAGLAAPEKDGQVAAVAAADPFTGISLEAKSAYVYDIKSDRVLYSLNAGAQLPLASLTKVALALVVSEVLPADSVITMPYDTAPSGSAERLAAGEKWRVSDVLTFTLVASSNAGAEILAGLADGAVRTRYSQAPEGEAMLWRMNDLSRQLRLTHTYFLNVSGLDISESQAGAFGSAEDMARLFAYAASSSPSVFGGTVRDGILLTSENGDTTSAFNTDKALGSIHGLVLGKTGFTDLAGGNLGIVFEVGPAHPVVAVVLGSSEAGRFEDIKKLVRASEEAVALY